MKKMSKVLVTMIFALAVIFATFVPSFAASSPAQVKSLKASTITYNSVKLTWSKASNSNKYYIERSTDGKKWTVLSNTSSTSYTATKLTTGTTYKFRVRGYRTISKKYGKYSAIVSAKPVPAQVTGLKAASTTATTAKLTWTKVTGATGYFVFNGSKKVATVKTNTATIKSLTPNTTYKYKVQAYTTVSKKNITGKASSVISVKPVVPQVTGLKATVKNPVTVTLKWTAVSGATSYIVYNGSTKAATVKTNSATVSSLVPGKTYKFKVVAYVGKVAGKASSVVSASPAIAQVTGVKATQLTPASAKLTWTKVTNATGYEVYNGTQKVAAVTTNTATVTGLTPNVACSFTVKALYNSYAGAASEKVSFTPALNAPTSVKASQVNPVTAKITWTAVTDATGYKVFNGDKEVATVKTTEATVDGLVPNTAYTFTVKALYNSYAGAASEKVSFTPALNAPTSVTVSDVTTSSAKINWTASTTANVSGYYVYVNDSKTATVTGTSYSITGLEAGTAYTVKVAAYYGSHESASTFTFTTCCEAPTNVKFTDDTAKIYTKTLTWDAVNGAEGYHVYVDGSDYADVTTNSCSISQTENIIHSTYVVAYHNKNGYELSGAESSKIPFAYFNSNFKLKAGVNSEDDSTLSYIIPSSSAETKQLFKYKVTGEIVDYAGKIYKNDSLNLRVNTEDGITTVQWDKIDSYSVYEIQYSMNPSEPDSWITIGEETGNISDNICKLVLVDDQQYSFRVFSGNIIRIYNTEGELASSYWNMSLTGSCVNEDGVDIAANSYKYYSPRCFDVCLNYKVPANSSYSDNVKKTKTVMQVIDAINKTKTEQDAVKVTSSTGISANTDETKVIYDGLILKNQEASIDWLLKLVGGEDLASELQTSMGENETCTFDFENGYGIGTITTSEKTTTNSTTTLQQFISPQGSGAYLYDADDVNNIGNKISNIKSSQNSDGTTTISFSINKETATPTTPYTYVHDGIVEGFSEAVESMADLDSSSYLTSGATTVSVVINSDGTLNSMNTSSPFSFNMTMDAGNTELGTFTIKSIKMVLSGTATHSYTFTR